VLTRFDDSRLVVASTPRYFAVTNLSKGGCVRVFARSSGILVYEDAGYFLTSPNGDWSSQLLGESSPAGEGEGVALRVTACFAAVKRELLTPPKFLLLRILNLTVFRSVRLGALVRRMIIARLITGRERGKWSLRRSVTLESERVVLQDEVVPDGEERVTFATLERSLLPVHMGSAKYFHANELAPITLPALTGWTEALSAGKAATLRQVIAFGDRAVSHSHELGVAPRTAPKERSTE
jgi:hypothetical protein